MLGQQPPGRHWPRAIGRAGVVEPEVELLFGHDPARHERVDADVELAEVARQAARQPLHRRLGRGVEWQAALLEQPADRAEVDDRAAAGRLHAGGDGLRSEELVLEVDRDARVPALGRGLVDAVALVVGGVVDQHGDRPDARAHRVDRGVERGDVGEVGGDESGAWRALQARGERLAGAASMSMKPTLAPWAAKCSTRVAPMPVAPPVISTVRSTRLG